MIPILFEYNETDFTTHGIGDLIDCIECKAKVTGEGEYELTFGYPANGELFSELQIGRIVLAKANDYDDPQQFRIYGVESGINQTVTVNCQHISYDLASYPVKIFKDQLSPAQAIAVMNNNIVTINSGTAEEFPFTISGYQIQAFNSDRAYTRGEYAIDGGYTWQAIEDISAGSAFNAEQWTALAKFAVETPKNVREVLLDGDDSILGLYGGDVIFNNRSVAIEKTGGYDRGVVIEYGVDLVDFTQDKNITEMVTGVLPFWKGNIRGSESGSLGNRYEVFTGDQFEEGYTYYTRNPIYSRTSDTAYNLGKIYYVAFGNNYRGITLDDMDFKPGVVYYEPVGFSYNLSSDSSPVPGVTYYVYENGAWRQTLSSDLDFRPNTVYYELSESTYVPTQDQHYSWDKTYYIQSQNDDSGSIVYTYTAVSIYYLVFRSGLTVYTRSATGYEKTEDASYQSGKSYFLATPNLGSFIPVDFTDLAFQSNTDYFEETGFSYTVAPSYQAGTVYYVSDEISDKEVVVYGSIQYADGFDSLPASAQRIKPLDLSEFFEAEKEAQTPSEDRLNRKAKQYILANDIGIPAIDLTVEYARLQQDVRLHDAITVKIPKLGISTTAKVSSYTYDVLKEICTEIEVKNAKATSSWSTLEDASRLRKGLIAPSRIGKKSITGDQISSGTIDGTNISSGGVGSDNLAPQAVTTTKIADNAITYNQIVDGAVTASKISDGAVRGQHILDQAISLKKLDENLQVFYSDVVAALKIYADTVKVDRYIDTAGVYAHLFAVQPDYNSDRAYDISLHTHYISVDDAGNVKIGSVDWTGATHSAKVKAVFGA